MNLICLKRKGEKAQFGSEKGFTLIEMAIVLVIIGLIIGAVVKGKDLIQSAKQKKFYTKSLKAWELAVVNYYDRTGKVLGDGTANGGTATAENGQFDNVYGGADNTSGINKALAQVGLTVPTSNTANSGQYSFKGQYSGNQTITLYLYYLHSTTDNRNNNCLYLTNVPTDLAIALDTMIDGKMDAKAGNFRRYTDDNDWPDASATTVVNAMYIMNVP